MMLVDDDMFAPNFFSEFLKLMIIIYASNFMLSGTYTSFIV